MLPGLNIHTKCSCLNYDVKQSRRGSKFLFATTGPELSDDHYESCLGDLKSFLIVTYTIWVFMIVPTSWMGQWQARKDI